MKKMAFVLCLLAVSILPVSAQIYQTFHGPLVAVGTSTAYATRGAVNLTELLLTNSSADNVTVSVGTGGVAADGTIVGNNIPYALIAQVLVYGGTTQVVSFGSGLYMGGGVSLLTTEVGPTGTPIIQAQATWKVVAAGLDPNGRN